MFYLLFHFIFIYYTLWIHHLTRLRFRTLFFLILRDTKIKCIIIFYIYIYIFFLPEVVLLLTKSQ
jgi:hypothetical protein